MEESDFIRLAEETLAGIEAAVEELVAAGLDLDFELMPGGILELEAGEGGKIIINRHGVAQEIWLADRSGGFHFRWDGGEWCDTRDSVPLPQRLSAVLSAHLGVPVQLNWS